MKIATYSYVKKCGVLVPFCDISAEEREKAATQMTVSMLNELYAGKARIYPTAQAPAGAKRL